MSVTLLAGQGPEAQILLHGQSREQPSSLRYQSDAELRNLFRRLAADCLAVKGDRAGSRRHDAEDALECGGFAGAVSTQQRRDLIGADGQADVVKDMAFTVKRIDSLELQQHAVRGDLLH